ncbi:MAG: hypothetical protein HYX71_01635 [Opitutae bacterium]|nr:hypothetical protein [Opitutae bacterium]
MTLLLGLLLIVFLGALLVLRRGAQARIAELQHESRRNSLHVIKQWIDLSNQPLQRFARDFGEWPELAAFLDHRDGRWAEKNLRANLANYDAHALWVISAKGELLYSAQTNPGPPLPPPATLEELAKLARTGPGHHLFTESRDGLLQVWGEPIAPDQTGENARGWLLVARWWSPRFLANLSRLAEMTLQLVPPGQHDTREADRLLLPLQDIRRNTLRQLQTILPLPDFTASLAADTLAVRVLLLFGLLVIATVWLGVQQWILRPLQQISLSLAREDPAGIATLRKGRDELGRVAELVGISFAQKQAMLLLGEERQRAEQQLRKSDELVRRSLELRARLARDLHDGVIQSIYAAGLGLESALSDLEQNPTAARTRLANCRQSLNSVIREVRGFIDGLEPEQIQRHGFAQELAALARSMQALWPVRIVTKVAAAAARALEIGQEIHALHICRECISNALRHGEAKKILIILNQEAGLAALTVRDDGHGFDPAQAAGQGYGLKNLAARARELGGALQVDSRPGHGTAVTVKFPLKEAAA